MHATRGRTAAPLPSRWQPSHARASLSCIHGCQPDFLLFISHRPVNVSPAASNLPLKLYRNPLPRPEPERRKDRRHFPAVNDLAGLSEILRAARVRSGQRYPACPVRSPNESMSLIACAMRWGPTWTGNDEPNALLIALPTVKRRDGCASSMLSTVRLLSATDPGGNSAR